ncbi:hypothetical protein BDV93DRAFT_508842 [Ceratobasidium sp. AG-I]|nr:hypothetical protein BDV93DRAFT_508842 [Ceratobasidium sp. AG-I]
MASHPPGVHTEKFRHRITEIKLEPSTSNYNINLKILVDGQEAHRLQPIRRGAPLLWNRMIPCDVHSGSIVELRIYERHFLAAKRVGIVSYDVSEVWGQPEDIKARANAIAEAQALEKQTKLLKRLGPTRDALKKILDFSGALSELHPGAKAAFGMCKIAWQKGKNSTMTA